MENIDTKDENAKSGKEEKKSSFAKKSFAVFLGLFLVLAAAFYVFLSSKEEEKTSFNASLGANIAYVEGTVEYKEKKGKWKRASEGVDLFEGYSVEVLGEGKAIINLDDGSALRLNSNSSTTLESMHPKQIIILNNKGEIYSRVVKSNHEFKVKSDNIIYESLGTAYKTVNSDEKKGVEVYQSKVKVAEKKEAKENKETVVEEGKKYYLLNKEEPKSVKVVEEISKEEIKKDKFVMWNKEQDETEESFKEKMGVLSDLTPPKLSIISPANGFKTETKTAVVKGETEKGAKILVNGKEAKNKEGKFSLEVSLKEGENKIKVESIDKAGNKTVKSIIVTKKIVAVKPVPLPTPKPTPTPTPKSPSYSFALSGKAVDNGIKLTWSVSGIDVSKGFKIARSKSENPVYPGNDYKYISDSKAGSYIWKISDGNTYHFRICQYLGGKCGKYSNDIKITAPKIASEVKSITLSIKGEGKVKWTVDGYSANGFKLAWSKNSKPTYPTREGDEFNYFSDPDASSASIDAFDGAGKYYVRVCQYIGGKCGVYSNQIEIDL